MNATLLPPVVCTCRRVLPWKDYEACLKEGKKPNEAMDRLACHRRCCRLRLLTGKKTRISTKDPSDYLTIIPRTNEPAFLLAR
jgi:DNA-directed RNA polymerase subunit N (RpoN/RPB10)